MQAIVPQKIGRVLGNLITHPQYITRCLAHNVIHGGSPLDLELPGFSYGAIDFLEGFLERHMSVFEYGAGGSTVFFARRVKAVCAVEENPEWHGQVSRRLGEKALGNVRLLLRPFDFKRAKGFETSDYLLALPDERFDVIVIEAGDHWNGAAPVCFAKAEAHVKHGGVVVVDDSRRHSGLRARSRAREHKEFISVGPARSSVTSTAVFFY